MYVSFLQCSSNIYEPRFSFPILIKTYVCLLNEAALREDIIWVTILVVDRKIHIENMFLKFFNSDTTVIMVLAKTWRNQDPGLSWLD